MNHPSSITRGLPARRIAWAMVGALLVAGCGRVERQMVLSSQPEGALVFINGAEAGRTPVTVDFSWYGRYDIVLRMDDYQTLKTTRTVVAPWWQWVPIDLLAEVAPGRKMDRREYHFTLEPQPQAAPPEELIGRAEQLRQELESGRYTRSTTQPAR